MNNEIDTISILGCGWLGFPLALFLKEKGYHVKGSVRNENHIDQLKKSNIEAHYINFSPKINPDYSADFFNTSLLFINIPPGRKNPDKFYYLKIISNIIDKIKLFNIPNIFFISSTSVYPDINNIVNEEMNLIPDKESGNILLKSEQLLMDEFNNSVSIIRFGGLIGADRNPARFLAGKQQLQNAGAPVNLIHIDDCINIIEKLISYKKRRQVYNACMPEHPIRKDFYSKAAQKYNLDLPVFLTDENPHYKIVDSSSLINDLKYRFIYKNPFDCI